MATFEAQVEAQTGLTIDSGSSPTQDELSQFLKDGVLDVTSRCLAVRPQDSEYFVVESTESSSQGGLSTDGGKILHVMRESGTNDDWRECKKIPIGLKDRVTDSTSLYYASAYSPAYILSQYGAVLVFPAPSGSSGQYRIYYVNKTPVNNVNGNALAYSDSTVRYFPDDKVYLVVIYASIKSLYNALSAHTNPTVVPNFGDAENWISIEEDPEMLAGRIQTINSQITEFQAKVQESVVDYGWMEQRAKSLVQEYNNAFASMVSPSQRAQQPQGAR